MPLSTLIPHLKFLKWSSHGHTGPFPVKRAYRIGAPLLDHKVSGQHLFAQHPTDENLAIRTCIECNYRIASLGKFITMHWSSPLDAGFFVSARTSRRSHVSDNRRRVYDGAKRCRIIVQVQSEQINRQNMEHALTIAA